MEAVVPRRRLINVLYIFYLIMQQLMEGETGIRFLIRGEGGGHSGGEDPVNEGGIDINGSANDLRLDLRNDGPAGSGCRDGVPVSSSVAFSKERSSIKPSEGPLSASLGEELQICFQTPAAALKKKKNFLPSCEPIIPLLPDLLPSFL